MSSGSSQIPATVAQPAPMPQQLSLTDVNFWNDVNSVMNKNIPLNSVDDPIKVSRTILSWYTERLSDDELSRLMPTTYMPNNSNRLDLFKNEISSLRGSTITCIEPTQPNNLPDGVQSLSSDFFTFDSSNPESRDFMLKYTPNDSGIKRWDGCDTSSGTSKFGPKNITLQEFRNWSKNQPNMPKTRNMEITKDSLTTFGDVSTNIMGAQLFPPNRQFEDCVNELLNDYEDGTDTEIINEIHEIHNITQLRPKHIQFIKRKLELLLISKSRVSIKQCMIDYIFNDRDPCSTDLAHQMLIILNILFSTIGFNLHLDDLDNDDPLVKQKLIEIIDELGDLIPRALDKVIDISEEIEIGECGGAKGKTLILKEMNKMLFNPQKKEVNIDLGLPDISDLLDKQKVDNDEFQRISILGAIAIAIFKFI
tara:strand:+ start:12 stop:1277 length:1266 start_codon:yes stop_codon:yes gene_type:complete